MNGALGPVSTAASARPATSPGAASDSQTSDTGFAAALEDAQGPASAPSTPSTASGAAKARVGAAAKVATPATVPPAREAAPVDASAVGAKAGPAEPAAADTPPPQAKTAASESPIAPDLSLLLPGWPATLRLRGPSAVDLETTPGQDSTVRRGTLTDGLRRERAELPQTGAGLRPMELSQTASTRPAPPLSSAAALAAELAPASPLRAAAEGSAALPSAALHANFMPATAASVAAAAAAASATPPFEAQLAAALDSPAFAPALATQVSWLVREGVQHARLSLNPAEMGPVTIQIALDGTQARVDFSADLVATRAAIESSLPTLAAALNESGLKLAGGGVFDGQPRPGPQGQRGQSATRVAQPDAPADTGSQAHGLSRAPAVMPRGLVDLVA